MSALSNDDRALLESFSRPDDLIAYELDKGLMLVSEHRAKLAAVEAALAAAGSGFSPSDSAGDALMLTMRPAERVDANALVATGDISFDRTVRALGALCDEASVLRDRAPDGRLGRIAAFLSLFGHTAEDDGDGGGAGLGEGVLEAMVGAALPRFQDAANYCDRIAALVGNATAQIAALFGKGSTFAPAWGEVKLRPFFLALGDLLTCLVTVDAIVRGNRLVRTSSKCPK